MDPQRKEQLLLTLTGVFAWVASADEGADTSEFRKFTHSILESPFATHYSETDLNHTYKDMVDFFASDFESAMKLTQERLVGFKEDRMVCEEILRLAQAALVGDGKFHPSEENVIELIKKELNL